MKFVFVGDLSYICAIISFKNNFNHVYHYNNFEKQNNKNAKILF